MTDPLEPEQQATPLARTRTGQHCTTCRCNVLPAHGKCPWCDTRLAAPRTPDYFDELQRVLEATTLLHLTAPKEYA